MTARSILFRDRWAPLLPTGQKTETRRFPKKANSIVGSDRWDHLDLTRAYADPGFADTDGVHRNGYLKVPHRPNMFADDGVSACAGNDDTVHRVYPRIEAGDLLYVKQCHAIQPYTYWADQDDDEDVDHHAELVYFRGSPRVGVRRWVGPHAPAPDAFQGGPHDMTYLHETSALETGPAAKVERWRPSIFMPAWAARIFLTVLSVHHERLLDIDEAGAVAEGVGSRAEYLELWDELNRKTPGARVADNPMVRVLRFAPARRPAGWPEVGRG